MEVPGGEGVDVDVGQPRQRDAAAQEVADLVEAFETWRHEREDARRGRNARSSRDAPRREEQQAEHQRRRADGVDLQRRLDADKRRALRSAQHRGHQKVRVVVVDRVAREERIVRRRIESRELLRQRGMPDEVGGEVRPVVARPAGIDRSEAAERERKERHDEVHDEQARRRIASREARQGHQRLGVAPHEEPDGRAGREPDDQER